MERYEKLTPKAVIELAAPPTWVAAICPVLVGTALAYTLQGAIRPLYFLLLLLIAILMQSAVNALNDYFDFIKGTDTAENCIDITDAAIIYNHINPKAALLTALTMLAIAGILGLILVAATGLTLLWIGLAGAVVIFLYSAGPLPISYTPLGEAASGFVMGGLITYAVYYATALQGGFGIFYYAAPAILSIGLIMMTNNSCDIARDSQAKRRTLPVLLGKKAAAKVLSWAYVLTFLAVTHLAFWEFHWGVLAALPLAVHMFPALRTMFRLDFNYKTRRTAMKTAVKLAYIINLYYCLAILIGAWL